MSYESRRNQVNSGQVLGKVNISQNLNRDFISKADSDLNYRAHTVI